MVRSKAAALAKKMIGTPFARHGRVVGVGLDCVGVIIVIARECGSVPSNWDFDGYRLNTADGTLERKLGEFLEEIPPAEAAPGDVAIFKLRRRRPQSSFSHAGILSSRGLIHACMSTKVVAETAIRDEWKAKGWRAYRFKEAEHG